MIESDIELRRVPSQARSRERVDRILDAAAQLLTESGYDAVKTNHIAKQAGVSVGSIYQFFPNRVAIFHALAVRYLDRIADVLATNLGPAAPVVRWEPVIDRVIDLLAELWRTEPALMAVWLAIQNTAELRASDSYYHDMIVNKILVEFLKRVAPQTDEKVRVTMGRVMFEVTQRLLDYSMHRSTQDVRVVRELKIVLRGYIAAHVQMK